MKYCPECGTGTNDAEKFCPECGKQFESTSKINISDIAEKSKSIGEFMSKKLTLLMEKLKSEKTKSIIKSKKFIAGSSAIAGILILITVGNAVGNKKYSPEQTLKNFQKAIASKDIAALGDTLYTNNPHMKMDDASLESLINFFSSDYESLNNTIASLYEDSNMLDLLTYEGSLALLFDNELFALTIKEKSALFTKYAIVAKPLFINITSNSLNADIYINGTKQDVITSSDYSKKVGPLLPGNVDITLKTVNLFKEELSQKLSVEPAYLAENYMLEDYELNFFDDYNVLSLSSNVPEAKVFVNSQDTGMLVKDCAEGFGPLTSTDNVYLSYNLDGAEYKTSERSPYSYSSSLDLDFSYSDYKIIAANLAGKPATTPVEASDTAKKYIDKYASRDFIIPESDTVKLDFKALNNYNAEELFIARNEIAARHGFVDSSLPNLTSYFKSKSWFKSNTSYSSSSLSENEKLNYDLLKSIEFLKVAHAKHGSISSDYVLPNSNTVELTASDVSGLNDWELIIARNEIFARYGLEFSTKELIGYFKTKSWFTIDTSVGNDTGLTNLEHKNVKTILDEENKRVNSSVNHDLEN